MPSRESQSNNLALVPQWVAQQFYRHGLFCASQPLAVLVFAFVGMVYATYPLLTIPVYSGDAKIWVQSDLEEVQDRPRWVEKQPIGYIQQIVMKAAVHPYTEDLIRSDAFRGPLATAFKLHLSDVSEWYDRRTGLDMDHECLRTDGLAPRYRSPLSHILPDYGCLILSPANIWRKASSVFQDDANIVDTVFNFQRSREGHSSLADLMFGLRQRDTGLTKYPVNNRQRTITYGITVVLRQNKPQFISSLRNHLHSLYPLHAEDHGNVTNTVHLHFPERFNGAEYVPYTITMILLFLYVYYSFNKIDLVNSKLGIALTAVITVLGSLFMSLGLTGLSLGGSGFVYLVPYLVAALGLENILVVTKSIVSTPPHLDVKVRIAQGLSREGWNITRNLFSEITILTLGFFLGILDSSIQDFCLLAVMGLLTDFYLQTFFFLTVLSMDINRTRLVDAVEKQQVANFQHPRRGPGLKISTGREEEWLVAPPLSPPPQAKLPRRVRLFNFWAQRRVVSRFFLVAMIGWIVIVTYQTGLVEILLRWAGWLPGKDKHLVMEMSESSTASIMSAIHGKISAENISSIFSAHPGEGVKSLSKLQHRDGDYWRRLPYSHWPMLFGLYNISVYGNNIVLLPPILLSNIVSPEAVVKLRSPNEKISTDSWSLDKIKSALDMGDDEESEDVDMYDYGPELSPFVPTSPGELVLAFALAVPSILFLIYLSIVCYRFICNKNYARWRSREERTAVGEDELYTEIVQDGSSLCLQAHTAYIESLLTDGHLLVSQCLAGKMIVWDTLTGEIVSRISRPGQPHHSAPAQDSRCQENFLPKKEKLEGLAVRNQLRSRKSKSAMYNKFTDTFSAECKEGPSGLLTGSSIWSLDMAEGLVVVGCDSGRVEVYDVMTGELRCQYDDGRSNGVTHLKLLPGRVVVARIDGYLEFLEILSWSHQLNAVNRSRMRLISSGSNDSMVSYGEELGLSVTCSVRAHLQSISCLEVRGPRLITGSADHTLRVFRPEDGLSVYTLHGHCGPITCVFIDKLSPSTAGSASKDGMLCVWDLLTGACMYSIQAHSGAVLDIAHSPSCVVTLGEDASLCVWERHQGHLLNTVDTSGDSLSQLVMLTHNLIVTASGSSLVVWDVRLNQPVKIVRLGGRSSVHGSEGVKIIKQCGDTIICSQATNIRLVRFPILTQKID